MYRIVCSNQAIFDPSRMDELPVVEAKLSQQLNQAGSIRFVLPSGHPMYGIPESMADYVTAYDGDDEIFYGRILTAGLPTFTGQITYECEGALTFLMDSEVTPSRTTITKTLQEFFEWCIQQHNADIGNDSRRTFQLGNVTVPDKNKTVNFQITSYTQTKTVIENNLLNVYGGCLKVRYVNGVRYLDWLEHYSNTVNPQAITIGENVIDKAFTHSGENLYTVIRPVGKNGLLLDTPTIDVFSSEMISKLGRIVKSVSFSDAATKADLQTKANEYIARLKKTLLCSGSIKMVDMFYLDGTSPKVQLGDRFDNIQGLEGVEMTVSGIELDFMRPWEDDCEFANDKSLHEDSGRSGGSISKTSSGAKISSGQNFKHIIEVDDKVKINAETLELVGRTLDAHYEIINATVNNYTRLSTNVDELRQGVTNILATGVMQNDDLLTAFAGLVEIQDNDVIIKDGAGIKIRRESTEYGLWDEGNLTAGMVVNILDTDHNATSLIADYINIGGRALSTTVTAHELDLISKGIRITNIETDVVNLGRDLTVAQAEIAANGRSIVAINSDVADINSRVVVIGGDITELQRKLIEQGISITAITSDVISLGRDLTEAQQAVALMNNTLTAINTDVTDINSRVVVIGADLSDAQRQLIEQGVSLTAINSRVINLGGELTEAQMAIVNQNETITAINSTVTNINSQVVSIGGDLTEAQRELARQGRSITAINSDIVTIGGDLTELQRDLLEQYDSITAINSQLVTMNDVLANKITADQVTANLIQAKIGELDQLYFGDSIILRKQHGDIQANEIFVPDGQIYGSEIVGEDIQLNLGGDENVHLWDAVTGFGTYIISGTTVTIPYYTFLHPTGAQNQVITFSLPTTTIDGSGWSGTNSGYVGQVKLSSGNNWYNVFTNVAIDPHDFEGSAVQATFVLDQNSNYIGKVRVYLNGVRQYGNDAGENETFFYADVPVNAIAAYNAGSTAGANAAGLTITSATATSYGAVSVSPSSSTKSITVYLSANGVGDNCTIYARTSSSYSGGYELAERHMKLFIDGTTVKLRMSDNNDPTTYGSTVYAQVSFPAVTSSWSTALGADTLIVDDTNRDSVCNTLTATQNGTTVLTQNIYMRAGGWGGPGDDNHIFIYVNQSSSNPKSGRIIRYDLDATSRYNAGVTAGANAAGLSITSATPTSYGSISKVASSSTKSVTVYLSAYGVGDNCTIYARTSSSYSGGYELAERHMKLFIDGTTVKLRMSDNNDPTTYGSTVYAQVSFPAVTSSWSTALGADTLIVDDTNRDSVCNTLTATQNGTTVLTQNIYMRAGGWGGPGDDNHIFIYVNQSSSNPKSGRIIRYDLDATSRYNAGANSVTISDSGWSGSGNSRNVRVKLSNSNSWRSVLTNVSIDPDLPEGTATRATLTLDSGSNYNGKVRVYLNGIREFGNDSGELENFYYVDLSVNANAAYTAGVNSVGVTTGNNGYYYLLDENNTEITGISTSPGTQVTENSGYYRIIVDNGYSSQVRLSYRIALSNGKYFFISFNAATQRIWQAGWTRALNAITYSFDEGTQYQWVNESGWSDDTEVALNHLTVTEGSRSTAITSLPIRLVAGGWGGPNDDMNKIYVYVRKHESSNSTAHIVNRIIVDATSRYNAGNTAVTLRDLYWDDIPQGDDISNSRLLTAATLGRSTQLTKTKRVYVTTRLSGSNYISEIRDGSTSGTVVAQTESAITQAWSSGALPNNADTNTLTVSLGGSAIVTKPFRMWQGGWGTGSRLNHLYVYTSQAASGTTTSDRALRYDVDASSIYNNGYDAGGQTAYVYDVTAVSSGTVTKQLTDLNTMYSIALRRRDSTGSYVGINKTYIIKTPAITASDIDLTRDGDYGTTTQNIPASATQVASNFGLPSNDYGYYVFHITVKGVTKYYYFSFDTR